MSPAAVVAPHAAWQFCGRVMASAFAGLEPDSKTRVLHLAPSHHYQIDNVVQSNACAFSTVLGACSITRVDHNLVSADSVPHEPEHALEVQLPFLQAILGTFEYVPLLVGNCAASALQQLLTDLGADSPDTLTVVSTDLSHYLPRDDALLADRATLHAIESLDHNLDTRQACGAYALSGLNLFARHCQWRAVAVDRCDTAGVNCTHESSANGVVGYAAVAFYRST